MEQPPKLPFSILIPHHTPRQRTGIYRGFLPPIYRVVFPFVLGDSCILPIFVSIYTYTIC